MAALGLSICTALYRSEDLSRRFHRELIASLESHDDWEIGYHDNSPTDVLRPALDTLPGKVSYRCDPRNLGFSYANNQLIRDARCDRILLLNPDVFGFTPEFWPRLLERPKSAAIFARLLNADGSFQDCVGEAAGWRRALSPARDYSRVRSATPVGMGVMAFMLTDRDTFNRVGLLDEDYPLYGEDMDWCFRAHRCGVPVLYDPGIELTHIGGASAADRWSRAASIDRKYAAERVFIDKHFRGWHRASLLWLNQLKVARLHARAQTRGGA